MPVSVEPPPATTPTPPTPPAVVENPAAKAPELFSYQKLQELVLGSGQLVKSSDGVSFHVPNLREDLQKSNRAEATRLPMLQCRSVAPGAS